MHCEAGGYRNVWQLWSTSEILNVVISGCEDNGHMLLWMQMTWIVSCHSKAMWTLLSFPHWCQATKWANRKRQDTFSCEQSLPHPAVLQSMFLQWRQKEAALCPCHGKKLRRFPVFHRFSLRLLITSPFPFFRHFSACNCWPDLSPLPELQAGRQAKNAFSYNLLQNRFSSCSMIQVESYFVRFIRAVVLGCFRHHSASASFLSLRKSLSENLDWKGLLLSASMCWFALKGIAPSWRIWAWKRHTNWSGQISSFEICCGKSCNCI